MYNNMNFTSYEQINNENLSTFGGMGHACPSSSHQQFDNLGNFPYFGRMDNVVSSGRPHHLQSTIMNGRFKL